jgi:excisionase family DNA binding protein
MSLESPMTLSDLKAMTAAAIQVRAAAGVLNVDPRTVGHGINDGTIPAIKIGKRVLVLREPLIRLLETGSAAPAA